MTTPEKQGKGLRDQIGREPETLSERVEVLQNKVKALGLTATLSVSDVKAFMDDLWGENDHSN
ncbi:hypothetical protein [Tropicimonas isoalkanivorans]|uniref:Uncharacterized protein n=1 Tax=Tropicimonas isoalkanivorans TaxID=441112 RepID=A0A1I1IG69_9RHOB|nr:hypothetical protein [Tropicimonas isoalkanivorans]SFC33228.1 hypothetical protein SAMN04488094_1043 [Tropicimonas isoalkanivorans]